MILAIIIGFFLVSAGIGFGLGWYVRGGEVKKLKESHRKLMQHAIDAGWVVTERELLENMRKIGGIYVPYVPATFSAIVEDEGEGP